MVVNRLTLEVFSIGSFRELSGLKPELLPNVIGFNICFGVTLVRSIRVIVDAGGCWIDVNGTYVGVLTGVLGASTSLVRLPITGVLGGVDRLDNTPVTFNTVEVEENPVACDEAVILGGGLYVLELSNGWIGMGEASELKGLD
jgi:hypothetical protein